MKKLLIALCLILSLSVTAALAEEPALSGEEVLARLQEANSFPHLMDVYGSYELFEEEADGTQTVCWKSADKIVWLSPTGDLVEEMTADGDGWWIENGEKYVFAFIRCTPDDAALDGWHQDPFAFEESEKPVSVETKDGKVILTTEDEESRYVYTMASDSMIVESLEVSATDGTPLYRTQYQHGTPCPAYDASLGEGRHDTDRTLTIVFGDGTQEVFTTGEGWIFSMTFGKELPDLYADEARSIPFDAGDYTGDVTIYVK